jgi:toxin CptA
MAHYSLKPIHADLRPSRWLAGLLGGVCLGACLVLAMMPLPAWLVLPACLLSLLATLHVLARDALLRLPASIDALEVTVKSELRCKLRSGEWHMATALGSSTVTPWLTVLNLKLPGHRFACHVVLTPDRLDAEQFRRLRVWLKWGSRNLDG